MIEGSDWQPSELVEVRLALPREHVDIVCDFIVQNICNGMVLEDEEDSEETTIIFYSAPEEFEGNSASLLGFLPSLFSDNPSAVPDLQVHRLTAGAWEEKYRQSVAPVVIDSAICIRPPWSEPIGNCPHDIILEPKMAFGTGRHETTRSCLRVLLGRIEPKARFLDAGCGSGILSILASQLGAAYIKAIDYDQTAAENCRENFAVNNVLAAHDIVVGTLDTCRDDAPYDVVCANIIKSTILAGLGTLVRLTAAGGVLVLSGLLEPDLGEVTAALEKHGLANPEILSDHEWRTITVRKPV